MELFLFFATLCLLSAGMTIIVNNPVYSVLYLIFAFVNASAMIFLLGVEFLAIIFLIIYVGAVAILFLFVVMMLNIRLIDSLGSTSGDTRGGSTTPISFFIGGIFLFEATGILNSFSNSDLLSASQHIDWSQSFISYTNIEALGQLLYTDLSTLFLLSSLILLVGMIGAIILSLDHHRNIRRQDIHSQIATGSSTAFFGPLTS